MKLKPITNFLFANFNKQYFRRSSFKLTAREERGLLDLSLFVVRCYLVPWFTAMVAAYAPRTDLQFIKNIVKYRAVNQKVSDIACHKVKGQGWYLCKELLPLTLFDDQVPLATKRAIIAAFKVSVPDLQSKTFSYTYQRIILIRNSVPQIKCRTRAPKRLEIPAKSSLDYLAAKELPDFVDEQSLKFFEKLRISTEFLALDPKDWPNHHGYQKALHTVRHLQVVNDLAERGVALVKEFTQAAMTKNEEQLQLLMQIVYRHRKQLPILTKTAIKEFDKNFV